MAEHDPSPIELEMAVETANGRPVARPAQQGIADMSARLKYLTGEKIKVLDLLDDGAERHELTAELNTLNTELREARDRLKEYELQAQSAN